MLTSDKKIIKNIVLCGNKIELYQIIIPKDANVNEIFFAYSLRNRIDKICGVTLGVISDNVSTSPFRILIGRAAHSVDWLKSNQYHISAKDATACFVAIDMRGYEAMTEYVTESFFDGLKREYVIENGFSYTGDAAADLEDGTKFVSQINGDVRVMFWNILGLDGAYGSTLIRQPLQREVVLSYAPSVIGFQEMARTYQSVFTPMLEEVGYSWIDTKSQAPDHERLFYDSKKVKLLKFGHLAFSANSKKNAYGVTWGIFEENRTKKIFSVLNTHFMWNSPELTREEAIQARTSNAEELCALVKDILDEYPNIALVLGGDLNCRLSNEPVPHSVFRSNCLQHARDIAEEKNEIATLLGAGKYDEEKKTYIEWNQNVGEYFNGAIDHVYMTDNTDLKTFCILNNLYCKWVSDHRPMLIEFNL